MKRVLVTGVTGFIGRHAIQPLLARGYEVHGVSSRPRQGCQQGVQYHQADLLNVEEVMGLVARVRPTHLLHFAWYAVPGQYWTSPENVRWVQASLSLLQAFSCYGGRRVVMAGTCAEYDWRYGYCSEEITPLSPVTLYGACKHALQLVADRFCHQAGLSSAWGRIFFVYGPHERPERLVPSVVLSCLRSEPARCSDGSQVRDLLHVSDVASAFVALLDSEMQGPVNIASGSPVRLRDLVDAIADRLGCRDLAQLGALPRPAGEPAVLIANVKRLLTEVGWSPRYDLPSGLDQTIAWWVEHKPVVETREAVEVDAAHIGR